MPDLCGITFETAPGPAHEDGVELAFVERFHKAVPLDDFDVERDPDLAHVFLHDREIFFAIGICAEEGKDKRRFFAVDRFY